MKKKTIFPKKEILFPLGALILLIVGGIIGLISINQKTILKKGKAQPLPEAKLLGRVVNSYSQYSSCEEQVFTYGGDCGTSSCFGGSNYTIIWNQGSGDYRLTNNHCDGRPRYSTEYSQDKPVGSPEGVETTITIKMEDQNLRLAKWSLRVTDGSGQNQYGEIQSGDFYAPGPNQKINVKLYRSGIYEWNHLTIFVAPVVYGFVPGEIIVKATTLPFPSSCLININGQPAWIKENLNFLNLLILGVPGNEQAFRDTYNTNYLHCVEYAELNYLARPQHLWPLPQDQIDPKFSEQWGLTKIRWPEAWGLAKGIKPVKIAILDTGIDKTHEDLPEIEKAINYTSLDSSDTSDPNGHGTHAAGIIGAVTGNGRGITGFAGRSNFSLLVAKVLGPTEGNYSWTIKAINWAINNQANVINFSLSGPNYSRALKDAIDYAWGQGAVLVCASGNDYSNNEHYPAALTNCLAVAASDNSNPDQKIDFSNYGDSWVDVAAPGGSRPIESPEKDILSTLPNNRYEKKKGTSMAAPFAAGLAALLLAENSNLTKTNEQVKVIIEETADHNTIASTQTKWGRIDAYQALLRVPSPTLAPSVTPPSPSPTKIPRPTPTPVVIRWWKLIWPLSLIPF